MLVIRDTRASGEMLEAAVAAGVAAAGGIALLGGVLPTPAAPLLIRRYGFDLGVVLSASHNPWRDNGVKFFGADGDKLSDAVEEEIEALLDGEAAIPAEPGGVATLHGTLEDYLRELHTRFDGLDLSGRRILLDCAQRRHPQGRAGDLPPPRRARRRDRRRARRSQHQRRLRLDARRGARRARSYRRVRRRLRVRRRRRPRARRRPRRRDRRRRRADRARCTPSARAGPPAGRRRGRDGDDELRLPHGDGDGRHRGRDDLRRRPLRARSAARARLVARRRAVRPHRRARLRALRGRDRECAAHAGGPARRRLGRAPCDGEAAAAARQRAAAGSRRSRARGRRRGHARGCRARAGRAVRPWARARASVGHRAAAARDGGGAERRGGGRRLRAAGRAGAGGGRRNGSRARG